MLLKTNFQETDFIMNIKRKKQYYMRLQDDIIEIIEQGFKNFL